ncbi:MAG: DUF2705 family protein [Clostridium sp.]
MDNSRELKNQSVKTFLMQIKHDFLMGTIYSWKKYIIVFLIFLFFIIKFQGDILNEVKYNSLKELPNFSDYVIEMYKGREALNTENELESLKIPSSWMLINIFLSFIIGYYPLLDLKKYGTQILLRSKKRHQWFLSKCIWIIGNVIIYYAIGYIVMIIFSLFNGGVSLIPTSKININISQVNTTNFEIKTVLILGMVLPIVTSISLSIFQMTLALFTTSIFSNITIISILIVSVYYCSFLLSGNYLMILRNSEIALNGVNTSYGLIVGSIIIILSIIIGTLRFNRIDILEKK